MRFRQAEPEEFQQILRDGYAAWPKGRTFDRYCADNRKEEAYGTRFVLENDGRIVSSLIYLRLPDGETGRRYGIGSVVTSPEYRGNGYASVMVGRCLRLADPETDIVMLYSDIDPAFYGHLGFRALPEALQKKPGSVCMAFCCDRLREDLFRCPPESIPDYF